MQKVLLITNIPTPYRIPLFNVLNDALGNKGVGFKAVFGALGYARRQWRIDMRECGFPHEVLPTTHLRFSDSERASFTYSGLMRVLDRERPDVIISNGFSIATTKLWAKSLIRSTPYIIWSGDIANSWKPEHRLRLLQRRLLVRRAVGFIAYSSRARDYLLQLGACAEEISIGINTVDTTHFARLNETRNANADEAHRLLFIGDLVSRKGVDRLLKIVQVLARRRQDFVLDIVGSGSEQPKLEQLSKELQIEGYVNFIGFKQKQDIPYYLARASCFVFPTHHDIWGLVLVEAMAAGLPCLSSVDAGATFDLIRDGETGFALDFSDTTAVSDKIGWLLDHPAERESIGRQAKNFIAENVTLKKSAEGFVAAIERALGKRDKPSHGKSNELSGVL
jgi:glycosyltransferase involved in cell wall biosynthesis